MKLSYIAQLAVLLIFLLSCNKKEDSYNGYVKDNTVYIVAQLSGKLLEMSLIIGGEVKKDDIMFKQDNFIETTQRNILLSKLEKIDYVLQDLKTGLRDQEVASIQASLDAAQAEKNNYFKEYQRAVIFKKDQIISEQSLDELETRLKIAEQKVKGLENKLAIANTGARSNIINQNLAEQKSLKYQLEQAEYMLTLKEPKSLYDGVVHDIYYEIGELIVAGSPVISISPSTASKIIFYLPIFDLPKIKLGQNIRFKVDGVDEEFEATIIFISSVAEYTPPVIYSEKSRQKLVYKVEAEAKEGMSKIFSGQPVDIFIN